jgi:hypothetical protein
MKSVDSPLPIQELMPNHSLRQWRDTWLDWSWIFASMPAILGGILLSHAVHLRLALGRWPARMKDYPPERGHRVLLDIHELGLVLPGIWLTLLAIPLWMIAAFLARPRFTGRTAGLQAIAFVLAIGVLVVVNYALSSTYMGWLID